MNIPTADWTQPVQLRAAGISTLPANTGTKLPHFDALPRAPHPKTGEIGPTWDPFRTMLPTHDQIAMWPRKGADIAAIVYGNLSHLELFDIDLKGERAHLGQQYLARVRERNPGLYSRLVIWRSKSGGLHVPIRLAGDIPGNQQLARAYTPHESDSTKVDSKTLIETRGEGGYGVFWPMVGCEVIQGDPLAPPVLTAEERELLVDTARDFDEGIEYLQAALAAKEAQRTSRSTQKEKASTTDEGPRPGDLYAQRATMADVEALLRKAGATVRPWRNGNGADVTRPGKDPRDGSSGNVRIINGMPILVQFSSNWPMFTPGEGYNPFQVLTFVDYNGEFSAAATALYHIQKPPLRLKRDGVIVEYAAPSGKHGKHQYKESPPPPHEEGAEPTSARPIISITGRELRDIAADALACLAPAGANAAVYQRNGQLVRVRSDEHNHTLIEPLVVDSLCGVLARQADWKTTNTKSGELRPAPPPAHVVRDVLALGYYTLPALVGIVDTPTMRPDGTVLEKPGYDAASQLIYQPAPGLVVPTIPSHPTTGQVKAAAKFLLENLFKDFPFQGEADKAHAVGLSIATFAREMIAGPTPLHLIDAPSPGTGKGLLIRAATLPAFGNRLSTLPEAESDAEWRKRITALLQQGARCISIDNVTHNLDSGSLASALTETVWADRLLGSNAIGTFPVRALWTCTANNPVLSMEIARRSVRTRLDTNTDAPWLNRTFKHKNLLGWAHRNRGELVAAILTLIRGWVCASRPVGDDPVLGTFEAWSRVVGGVLHFSGILGFLSNLSDLYAFVDSDTAAWHAFVELWWSYYADKTTATTVLFNLAVQVPELDIGGGNERGQRLSFGKALAQHQDRVIGTRRVEKAGIQTGLQHWRLRAVGGK